MRALHLVPLRLHGRPEANSIVSHYRPPPNIFGCSQAAWLGRDRPALVRNHDFPLDIVPDRFEATAWFGHEVIAKAQRPWGGCLDGMNQDGLIASLNFGGSHAQGVGFSVILLLRYVLETCRRVDQAIAALSRIPIAISQNVTVLDRSGAYAAVFLGPDRVPAVSRVRACTNHQELIASPRDGRPGPLGRAAADCAAGAGRTHHDTIGADRPVPGLEVHGFLSIECSYGGRPAKKWRRRSPHAERISHAFDNHRRLDGQSRPDGSGASPRSRYTGKRLHYQGCGSSTGRVRRRIERPAAGRIEPKVGRVRA